MTYARSLHFSDNGREFDNYLIKNLVDEWDECTLVHGKPRHSQSQGSVERANQDIENMLFSWMRENKSTNWSKGLPEIQFGKNRALNKGIGRSPYQAMFGCKPRTVPRYLAPEIASASSNMEDNANGEYDQQVSDKESDHEVPDASETVDALAHQHLDNSEENSIQSDGRSQYQVSSIFYFSKLRIKVTII